MWAPSELAALFGAQDGEETILKLTKSFYGLVHAPRKWHESVVEALLTGGWTQSKADRCLFCLYDDAAHELIALAGIHVDDFLVCGVEGHSKYEAAKEDLRGRVKFGKWCEKGFDFAGCHLKQTSDGIYVDQEDYVNKWLEEVPLAKSRERGLKSPLTAKVVSLRAVLGTLSWKASQTGPHHQAEVSLLLSSVPQATVSTLVSAHKLVREIRKEASQTLWFPTWNRDWRSIAAVVWADASQNNRPKKSGTSQATRRVRSYGGQKNMLRWCPGGPRRRLVKVLGVMDQKSRLSLSARTQSSCSEPFGSRSTEAKSYEANWSDTWPHRLEAA